MTTPTQSVFDIPELLVCICQYLTQHDMAQCVATSKSFARVFEPFLYQHFYNDSRETFDSSGLIRNLHHLETAEMYLETAGMNPETVDMCLGDKLSYLTSIIHGLLKPEEWPVEFKSGLPETTALSKGSPICTNLKRLDDRELECALQEALAAKSANGTITNKITSLQLPDSDQGYPKSFLLPILQSELLDLKQFTIPLIVNDYYDELKTVLRKHCPKLKYLDCPFSPDPAQMDYNTMTNIAFFEVCTGLVRFCGTEFEDRNYCNDSRGMVRALVRHQSETLEEIEFLDCHAVRSKDLQAILASCKRLRKLKVITPSDSCGTLELEDIVTGEWVCRGLKSLWLVVASRVDRARKYEAVAKLAYGQIGRMLELETLILAVDHSDFWTNHPDSYKADLTLAKGWLGELMRLKRLRYFGMRDDFWSRMGQAEVEFMHEEWPKLDTIVFGVHPSLVVDLPHWKWLKQKRPLLRYIHQDSHCE
ncbi:hypothetical protein BG011_002381 [Mortierella polycephala]|uniref:F-box domain-containing protein n=1 Tax=Mortierella polycephala TaxID=41804 RepID=A0A9P6Q541_9FUNG|nr:hypothetical protein BG011_002381 [Mortierella polycephala]